MVAGAGHAATRTGVQRISGQVFSFPSDVFSFGPDVFSFRAKSPQMCSLEPRMCSPWSRDGGCKPSYPLGSPRTGKGRRRGLRGRRSERQGRAPPGTWGRRGSPDGVLTVGQTAPLARSMAVRDQSQRLPRRRGRGAPASMPGQTVRSTLPSGCWSSRKRWPTASA